MFYMVFIYFVYGFYIVVYIVVIQCLYCFLYSFYILSIQLLYTVYMVFTQFLYSFQVVLCIKGAGQQPLLLFTLVCDHIATFQITLFKTFDLFDPGTSPGPPRHSINGGVAFTPSCRHGIRAGWAWALSRGALPENKNKMLPQTPLCGDTSEGPRVSPRTRIYNTQYI